MTTNDLLHQARHASSSPRNPPPPVRRTRDVVMLIAWVAGLALALATLHFLDRGSLRLPGLLPGSMSTTAWRSWGAQGDVAVSVLAIVRALATAATIYLAVATILSLVRSTMRGLGRRQTTFGAVLDGLTPVLVRSMTIRVVGATVAGSLLAPTAVGAAGATPMPPSFTTTAMASSETIDGPTLHLVAADDEPVLRWLPSDTVAPSQPTASPLPSTSALPTPALSTTTDASEPGAPLPPEQRPDGQTSIVATDPASTDPVPDAVTTNWTVQPGQNFWTIARDTLRDAQHREPSGIEIAKQWQLLIDTNRHNLPNPADPDLLAPGQVLSVPPSTP